MRKYKTHSSDLLCSNCGSIMTIPRYDKSERGKYHIKDLYCIKCRKVTKHIELGESDIVKKELEFKDKLSPIEELIVNLTNEEPCKVKII